MKTNDFSVIIWEHISMKAHIDCLKFQSFSDRADHSYDVKNITVCLMTFNL